MMSTFFVVSVYIFVSLFVIGCHSNSRLISNNDDDTTSQRRRLAAEVTHFEDGDEYLKSVALIQHRGETEWEPFCTGTHIKTDSKRIWVLTAAHCVWQRASGWIYNIGRTLLRDQVRVKFELGNLVCQVVDIRVNIGWVTSEIETGFKYDYALIEVAKCGITPTASEIAVVDNKQEKFLRAGYNKKQTLVIENHTKLKKKERFKAPVENEERKKYDKCVIVDGKHSDESELGGPMFTTDETHQITAVYTGDGIGVKIYKDVKRMIEEMAAGKYTDDYLSVLYRECANADYTSIHCFGTCQFHTMQRDHCFSSDTQTRFYGMARYGASGLHVPHVGCTRDGRVGIKYLCRKIESCSSEVGNKKCLGQCVFADDKNKCPQGRTVHRGSIACGDGKYEYVCNERTDQAHSGLFDWIFYGNNEYDDDDADEDAEYYDDEENDWKYWN